MLPLACHYTDPNLYHDNAKGEEFSTHTLAGGLEVTSSLNGYYGYHDWYIDTAQEDEGIYTFYSPSAIDYNEYARLEIYNPLSVDVTLDVSMDADWLSRRYWIEGAGNTTYVYGRYFTNITLPAKKTLVIELKGDSYYRELQRATVQIVVDSSLLPGGNDGPFEPSYYYAYVNDTTYPFDTDSSAYFLVSTNKEHSSSSRLTMAILRDCTIYIEYGVSSESGYDYFKLTQNGTQIFRISGTSSDSYKTISANAGDSLVFSYTKDGSESRGSDCGYVYTMEFTAV